MISTEGAKSPKVSISYAHGDEDHVDWVVNLASRLRSTGRIETILDRWDKSGHS